MLACSPDVIVKPPYKLSPITWVVICAGFVCLLITLLSQTRGFKEQSLHFHLACWFHQNENRSLIQSRIEDADQITDSHPTPIYQKVILYADDREIRDS